MESSESDSRENDVNGDDKKRISFEELEDNHDPNDNTGCTVIKNAATDDEDSCRLKLPESGGKKNAQQYNNTRKKLW